MALTVFNDESDMCEELTECDRESARRLVNAYVRQTVESHANQFLFEVQPKDYEVGRTILAARREQQVAIAVDTAARIAKCGSLDYASHIPLKSLLSALLRKDLPFDRSAMERLVQTLRANSNWWHVPLGGILRTLERYIDRHGMTETIRESLQSLRLSYSSSADYAEERKLGQRIEAILKGGKENATEFDLNTGKAWTDALLVQLGRFDSAARGHWQALLAHCGTATSSSPSKKWLKSAGERMVLIGEQAFVNVIVPCLAAIGQPGVSRQVIHGGWTHHTDPTQIHATHANLLRGLVWATSLVPSEELIVAVGGAADMCFQKIRNIGPRSSKIGNACLQALSEMNHSAAVAQISRLTTRAKHVSIRKQLAKGLDRAAGKVGISAADLEEIAVPTFGFHEVGRYEERLDDCVAELSWPQSGKPQLLWTKPDGKKQKTVPAAIKETHASEIKALRQKVKAIEQQLPALCNRIEQLFLKQRSWNLYDFRQRFLDHPLVGAIARRVIWRFRTDDRTADGVWHNGKFVDSQDRELDWIDDLTAVGIWHPILSEADEVLHWREWLERHEVCQPFKQSHREIHILTDAERDTGVYSNRFAAHIIRQHQFAALCQQRGWRYSLQGSWDSANTPYLELPQAGLRAEYWVEAIEGGQVSERCIYLYLSTDQVRFNRLDDSQPVPMPDVPALVFSEVMRDVDLFVAVTSIGNDPDWSHGGPMGHQRDYWQNYALGDLSQSARTRREVLQRLVPQLKIASRCSFADKFLVVRGDLRTYKIHMGSGNVLSSPNDKYLCIVPQRGAGKQRTDNLFLPFDGDAMLSAILSKAFLLADDTKIKDDSILSQIRR